MKCCENFSMFEDHQTPMGIENLPDEMKPIAYKNSRTQNFDIILSKYFNNGELTDVELQQLNAHEKIIFEDIKKKGQTKTKRPDEYQKLFFKKAFKYAEHAFFKKNKKNRSRRMSQFYHYHFDSVANSLKIPLVNFYHPDKKTRPGLSTGQKSFNSSYVKMILKSITFRKVCMQYHEKFKQECRRERNKKISTFTRSLFSMVDKDRREQTKLIRFMQSSKCKIPWTDREIDEAYRRAEEELDDYSGSSQILKTEQQKVIIIKRDKVQMKEDKVLKIQKSPSLCQISSQQQYQQQVIQYLAYNDEQAQKKRENNNRYVMELNKSSQLITENGLNLGLSLDLMKI